MIEGWLEEHYIKLGELVYFENFREILGRLNFSCRVAC